MDPNRRFLRNQEYITDTFLYYIKFKKNDFKNVFKHNSISLYNGTANV